MFIFIFTAVFLSKYKTNIRNVATCSAFDVRP